MLGGMGRELDSQALQRLQEHYGEMSDGELLGLAERPDDLTDMAREVMRGEMAHRRLKVEGMVPMGDPFTGLARDPLPKPEFGVKLADGMVALTTFHDAIAAGTACDYLEAEGLTVDVRDVTDKSTVGGSFYGGPPVALQVIVQGADKERAVGILREKMGLFPLQEVEGDDEPADADEMATLGYFGRREDADEAARILAEAGFWYRVAANPEGSAEDEDAFSLEVKAVDQERAVEAVEKEIS